MKFFESSTYEYLGAYVNFIAMRDVRCARISQQISWAHCVTQQLWKRVLHRSPFRFLIKTEPEYLNIKPVSLDISRLSYCFSILSHKKNFLDNRPSDMKGLWIIHAMCRKSR